jgi:hypothetical protein
MKDEQKYDVLKSLIEGNKPVENIQPYRYQREFYSQYRFASAY